jgi:nucleoid DNA-binding protein
LQNVFVFSSQSVTADAIPSRGYPKAGFYGSGLHNIARMNKHDLVQLVAKRDEVSPSIAADHLDHVVTQIIRKLRKGDPVALPGVGVLKSNGVGQIELSSRRGRSGRKR